MTEIIRAHLRETRASLSLATFIPSILTAVVLAAGMIASYATTRAVQLEHERRLTYLEQNYIPRAEHARQDDALKELTAQIRELREALRQHDEGRKGR